MNPSDPSAEPPPPRNPPPRKRRRWLRRLGWAAIWIVTLLALLYAFEDWRGRRVWKSYVAEAKAGGEHLDPALLNPPAVPDDQNFAAAPVFAPLFDYEMQRQGLTSVPVWKDAQRKEYLDSLSYSPPRQAGNWRRGERTDLQQWYSKMAKGTPEQEVPLFDGTAKDEEAAAARRAPDSKPAPLEESIKGILSILEPVAPVMDEVAKAAARPFSRFPVRNEGTVEAIRPHLKPMMNFAQIARLRATARLAAGNREGAHEDTMLGFRLAEKMAGDPVLLGYLVRLGMEEGAMIPLWEGLVGHHWNDEQLQTLQRQIARINHAEEFQKAMRAERQFSFAMLDTFRASPRQFGVTMGGMKELGIEPPIRTMATVLTLIPKGWFDLNKAETGRLYQEILNIAEVSPARFHPDRMEAIEAELQREASVLQDYGKTMARLAASATIGVVARSAAAQSTVDLALIALALERHWLRHGSYPADLSALDPELIEKTRGIPADPLSGHPPRYRPTEDDRFVLYYDSWNQKDDGGVTEYNYPKGPKPMIKKGDWVWPRVVGAP